MVMLLMMMVATPRIGTTIDRYALGLLGLRNRGSAVGRYLRGCASVERAVLRQLARLGWRHDRPHHPDVRPTGPTRIRPSDLVHVLLSTRQQARLGVGGLGGREAEEERRAAQLLEKIRTAPTARISTPELESL